MATTKNACDAGSTISEIRSLVDDDMIAYDQRFRALPSLTSSGQFVQRLRADALGGQFKKKLRCLRPARPLDELRRSDSFDRDLLALVLKRGRACQHELCTLNRCGLQIRDAVVTQGEAAALVAHGQGVLEAEGKHSRDNVDHRPYVRVDFMRSAVNGSVAGHVLSLRVAERVRRIAADVFQLPLERVAVAETLLALRRLRANGDGAMGVPRRVPSTTGSASSMAERGSAQWAAEAAFDAEEGSESAYHCDEALAPHFHFSTIIWLSAHGKDFSGGELTLLHNRSWPWLVVEPAVGRAAFFSSGWENVHGIKPLERGERWALSVPLSVDDGLARRTHREAATNALQPADLGERFRADCIAPADKYGYQRCRERWAGFWS